MRKRYRNLIPFIFGSIFLEDFWCLALYLLIIFWNFHSCLLIIFWNLNSCLLNWFSLLGLPSSSVNIDFEQNRFTILLKLILQNILAFASAKLLCFGITAYTSSGLVRIIWSSLNSIDMDYCFKNFDDALFGNYQANIFLFVGLEFHNFSFGLDQQSIWARYCKHSLFIIKWVSELYFVKVLLMLVAVYRKGLIYLWFFSINLNEERLNKLSGVNINNIDPGFGLTLLSTHQWNCNHLRVFSNWKKLFGVSHPTIWRVNQLSISRENFNNSLLDTLFLWSYWVEDLEVIVIFFTGLYFNIEGQTRLDFYFTGTKQLALQFIRENENISLLNSHGGPILNDCQQFILIVWFYFNISVWALNKAICKWNYISSWWISNKVYEIRNYWCWNCILRLIEPKYLIDNHKSRLNIDNQLGYWEVIGI